MNDPTMANRSLDIALSSDELAALLLSCQRVLAARPALAQWLKPISVTPEISLPFLPIRCFRLFNVCIFSEHQLERMDKQVFRSSGSTNDVRATHILGATGWASYVRSSVTGYLDAARRLGIPEGCPIVSLVPPRDRWPESSLAAMVSLWKDAGLNVHYAEVEEEPKALSRLFEPHGALAQAESCVIFGTTIHHLTVAHWHDFEAAGRPFITAKNVWFFDTGGTKGRTVSTRPELIHSAMERWVIDRTNLAFLSEYGMCELSSQAYSVQKRHDGSFTCSPTLRALVIRPDLKTFAYTNEKGFLAFIDAANQDSWPFILTEDIGEMVDEGAMTFRLHGRAPDASIKGCSLNVRSHFRFDLSDAHAASHDNGDLQSESSAAGILFKPENLLDKLISSPAWNLSAREDLKASLNNWNNPEAEKEVAKNLHLVNKSLAITASANIPVTWLFPSAIAWLSGARAINLYLPSIRQEDPLSELTRNQIWALADAFNQCTRLNFIRVCDNRMPSNIDEDVVLVFGNDTTLEVITRSAMTSGSKAQFIGLGHFQNSIRVSTVSSASKLAQTTSRWFGRGCLTPLLAVLPDSWSTQEINDFAEDWLTHSARLRIQNIPSAINPYWEFSHRHNLAELESLKSAYDWKNLKLMNRTDAGTLCVILNDTPATDIEKSGLDQKLLEWGGCGWLTITTESNICRAWASLPFENPSPSLWEPHQGKLWTDWLTLRS